MRLKKRVAWLAMLLVLLLGLTGCSQNQQAIFDAGLKMQNVTSFDQTTTLSFKLSGSGLDPAVQQQLNTASAMLNNAKLNFDMKTNSNAERTVNKAQVDMKLSLQGMDLSMPVWVDMDLRGTTPKFVEIMKLPQIATGALPPQFAAKEYMVLNPLAMNSAGHGNLDMSGLVDLTKNLQPKYVEFLTGFSQRFNPEFSVVSKGRQQVQTKDGVKQAQVYEIKLNDRQAKNLVRYTVNNFAQDEEAMKFVKDYMETVLGVSQFSNDGKALIDFEKAFAEFESTKDESLAKFNAVMDQLDGVTLLGDQGIDLEYALADGYVIKKSGTIDLKLDLAQLEQLGNSLSPESSKDGKTTGTINLTINFDTVTSSINSPLEIQIPEVNDNNSFDYLDLMETMASLNRPTRVAGQDAFKTARAIGEEYNSGRCDSIILASGLNFPDALASSILAKKYDAPILLVGATVEDSSEAFNYIAAHSTPETKFYIIGGTGVIGTSFETALSNSGHSNLERISGADCYDTGMAIVNKAEVTTGTPVFVVSGESFADALSVSSLVGSKQYPTLLVGRNYLSEKTKDYLKQVQPSTVYIVGGSFVVSQAVEDQIKELVPASTVSRLAGNDRFDTDGQVLSQFSTDPQTVFLANGFNFLDGITGSALAAKNGNPVLFVDPTKETLPPAIEAYLKKLSDTGSHPRVRAIGGAAVVPDRLIQQAQNILAGSGVTIYSH